MPKGFADLLVAVEISWNNYHKSRKQGNVA